MILVSYRITLLVLLLYCMLTTFLLLSPLITAPQKLLWACEHEFDSIDLSINVKKSCFVRTSHDTISDALKFDHVGCIESSRGLTRFAILVYLLCVLQSSNVLVQQWLRTSLPIDLINDQFAFRPTGSNSSALVKFIHYAAFMLDENFFVRCLLVIVDFSKAFDVVRHSVLFSQNQQT